MFFALFQPGEHAFAHFAGAFGKVSGIEPALALVVKTLKVDAALIVEYRQSEECQTVGDLAGVGDSDSRHQRIQPHDSELQSAA